ncbi:NgoFVII family restriction endonuclease [Latilactobacillus fuchuensis]|uniref:NgoFVII family restriction endonuclease n=1 Tax=Latilactobacillus fuchuensis TaxID=164393 RepID=UPI0020C7E9B9|nr:NgoFVII family restriction endonuclease [Latilactobacillus fuchuensis]MCP8856871.1 NgoFVII family restriction endonuclease [Latilactobacillus fuchuensis]
MTIWNRYSNEQQYEYIEYLKMYGALSALFNQKASTTGAPYLDSKYQETVYARSFHSEEVDIGNTPHDIKSVIDNKNIGIGIKTWLNSKPSYQKVMQLKSFKDEIECFRYPGKEAELAGKIASIKNKKLLVDYGRLGLVNDKNIYHFATRDEGTVVLRETTYPMIELNKLSDFNLSEKSFSFTDGLKKYKYTFGDSQIWMYFDPQAEDTYELKSINIDIMQNPFDFLKDAFSNISKIIVPTVRDAVYLPLYSVHQQGVPEKSGLNASHGSSKNKNSGLPRPKYEAYIPVPKEFHNKYPNWFSDTIDTSKYNNKAIELNLHMPNGEEYPARLTQSGFKSLQTNPQSVLGEWLIHEVLGFDANHIITMGDLENAGFDSVKVWHEDINDKSQIWVDFAPVGSYKEFMSGNIPVEGDN